MIEEVEKKINELDPEYERKGCTPAQVHSFIVAHLALVVEPVIKQVGEMFVQCDKRLKELEEANNCMISEMKEWKEKAERIEH